MRGSSHQPARSSSALLVLAASGEAWDVSRLAKLVSVEEHRSAALFALGFTGSPMALEVCLAAMQEAKSAPVAGEAFSAITGLNIEGKYRRVEDRKKGREPIPFEEEDLDADLVPGPESELPVPDEPAIKQWWSANKSRFQLGLRYLAGAPLDAAALLGSLQSASSRRRPGLALELAIRTGGKCRVETRHWTRVQLAQQAATTLMPVMLPFSQLLTA